MYYFLSLLVGVVITVMISFNGSLTSNFGVYYASVIIHIVGTVFALVVCIVKKQKISFKNSVPYWAYLGGASGVLTTIFNNYAFSEISITSIIALGLLGQSVMSVLFDSFGMLGIEKRPIKKSNILGYIICAIGIFVMIDTSIISAIFAIIFSVFAGFTIVLSRTVNSRLAKATSPLVGSFFNHLVGLPICIILAVLLEKEIPYINSSLDPTMFFGGVLGVITVILFNIVVPKISSFSVTMLAFVGQIFSGLILDIIFLKSYTTLSLVGGIIISLGLVVNLVCNNIHTIKRFKKR